MNIHIIRGTEVTQDRYEAVVEILQHYPGPLSFVQTEWEAQVKPKTTEEEWSSTRLGRQNRMRKRSVFKEARVVNHLSWNYLFACCNDYRLAEDVGDEEFVILLTDCYNSQNWFSGLDQHHKNGFVHTADWSTFIEGDQRFPIAYQIVACILRSKMFNNYENLMEKAHQPPCGCINDFCRDKSLIHLKLRTADICMDCQSHFVAAKGDVRIFQQITNVLEGIRRQMLFKERFTMYLQPSRIEVKGRLLKLYLTDLDGQQIKLSPQQKTIYLAYLLHPDGLDSAEFIDQRDLVSTIYKLVSNKANLAEIENTIANLMNVLDDSLAITRSIIKRKITQLVGKDMAAYYIISGPNNTKKKIILDRSLVSWDQEAEALLKRSGVF